MSRKAAVIRGDGTGPELVDAMLKVINALEPEIELIPCEAGLEWWQKHGGDTFIPPETWEVLKSVDACFKGPTTTLPGPGTPKSVAVTIRRYFDLYANVRPIKTFEGTKRPLGDVDFICVREGTEGLYVGAENRIGDTAVGLRVITRRASERIARFAFNLARENGWGTVTLVHKANICKETDGLFLESARRVKKEFRDVELNELFVDNFAQQLIKNPQRFNNHIILGPNLYMDIISEEASALIASIGCVYSANMGDSYAMFEPAHGSAPKYKGLKKVNPTATILAGAWMLKYLGEEDKGEAIFRATWEVIGEGLHVTYDLGGEASTMEMAEAIKNKAVEIYFKGR